MRYTILILLIGMVFGVISCADDPVSPSKKGELYLYNDLKVIATTDFSMDDFTKELYSHETWKENTYSSYENGKWNNNHNAVEGLDGLSLPYMYEFKNNGYLYKYEPYTNLKDTFLYHKEPLVICMDERSITMGSRDFKIVAVDDSRIVLDEYDVNGVLTRYSLVPCYFNYVKIDFDDYYSDKIK